MNIDEIKVRAYTHPSAGNTEDKKHWKYFLDKNGVPMVFKNADTAKDYFLSKGYKRSYCQTVQGVYFDPVLPPFDPSKMPYPCLLSLVEGIAWQAANDYVTGKCSEKEVKKFFESKTFALAFDLGADYILNKLNKRKEEDDGKWQRRR